MPRLGQRGANRAEPRGPVPDPCAYHAPMCPWDGFAPANLVFCEAPVCGWIVHPADTWSNLGFAFVAVAMWWHARHRPPTSARWLALVAALTFVGSFALHGTSTFVGQALDQSAMFLQSAFFVVSALGRLQRRPWSVAWRAVYFALVAVSIAALLQWQTVGIALFAAQCTIFALVEARLFVRDRGTRYAWLATAVGLFAVSYGIWWFDKLAVWCRPDVHWISGHAVWHLLGAAGQWAWYRFFSQFE